MPKTKISEFSAVPGNNTDIDGINIAEGCAPSGINDAIRELMAQLKDFQAGTAGDSFNGPVGTTTPAAGAFTNLSASGTFALTGDQVQISEGGTGQTTANAAFNALAPSQSTHAGKYLKTDGTNTSWDALDISTADITGTLPIANGGTGLTALGTGVQTALGIAVGSSGAFVVNGGALGTPSSGTVTNLTGTASININGTVGATTPTTGAFTTLSASGNITVSGGTANGVAYLNGSKVLTTGSALTFDGSNLGVGVTTVAARVDIVGGANNQFRLSSSETDATTKEGKFLLRHYTNAQPNFLVMYPYSTSTDNAVFYGGGSSAQTAATFHAWMTAANNTTVSGTEQMRLTSTGLGIGTSSPTQPLSIRNAGAAYLDVAGGSRTLGTNSFTFGQASDGVVAFFQRENAAMYWATNSTERMRLDSSGNLGLGVTPSAWVAMRALQINAYGSAIAAWNTNRNTYILSNAYYDNAGFKYTTTGGAAYYNCSGETPQHAWFTAPSGTAGNAISFTQAMTLDASGNLGVGTTSPLDRLDVVSAGPNRSRIRSSVANEAVLLFQNSTTGTSTGDGFYLGIVGAADAYLWNYENNPLIFGTNNTERARIPAAGGFQCVNSISVGNATPTTSGAGITFPATQSASSNANTLDDYEEGTFTLSNGGNTTYTTRSGRYTKIGNFVKCCFFHNINTIGTGSATTLTGLPFAASSTAPTINGGVVTYVSGLAVSALAIGVYADSAAQIIFMTRNANDTNATTQLPAVMGNSFAVYAEVSYLID